MKRLLLSAFVLLTSSVARAENLKEILNCNNNALSLYRNLDYTDNSYGTLILVIRDSAAIFRLQRDFGKAMDSTFSQRGWNATGDIEKEAQNIYSQGPTVQTAADFKSLIGAGPIFNSVAHGYRAYGGFQLVYQTSGNEPAFCQGGVDDHEGHCIGGAFVLLPAREISDWFYPNCVEVN